MSTLDVTAVVGLGRPAFARAAAGVMAFDMHRRAGVTVLRAPAVAAVGEDVVQRLGPIVAPCRVVAVVEGDDARGFTYRALPGHPEAGEESFLVTIDGHGVVRLTVSADARPATWYARLGGPVTVLAQRLVVGRYVAGCRWLASRATA